MCTCNQNQFRGFFQEAQRPIWNEKCRGASEESESDIVKYGDFDSSQFTELELRCYTLIKSGICTMYELKNCYTLSEMLKLYALYQMQMDIENGKMSEIGKEDKY